MTEQERNDLRDTRHEAAMLKDEAALEQAVFRGARPPHEEHTEDEVTELREFLTLVGKDVGEKYDIEGILVKPTGSVTSPLELIFPWHEGQILELRATIREV